MVVGTPGGTKPEVSEPDVLLGVGYGEEEDVWLPNNREHCEDCGAQLDEEGNCECIRPGEDELDP